MPIIAPTTLFSHRFHFYGVSKYSEALVHRIITASPLAAGACNDFFNQLTFPAVYYCSRESAENPRENLRFDNTILSFSDKSVGAGIYPHGANVCHSCHWQMPASRLQASSMAQISNSLISSALRDMDRSSVLGCAASSLARLLTFCEGSQGE